MSGVVGRCDAVDGTSTLEGDRVEMTPMSAKVSVIVPRCNAARYVTQRLEGLRRQTWPSPEVIVVDDGSTDDGARIIETFAGLDLTLIRQSNRGQIRDTP